jgi:protein gp37
VFVNSMSDLFHDDVPDDFIAQVFAVMALAPQHTFQVLTKRPERMREFMRHVDLSDIGDHFYPLGDRMRWDMDLYIDEWGPLDRWPLPNVWLGVSVDDQATADQRIPLLQATPAALRFVSYEPALGPVDFTRFLWCPNCGCSESPCLPCTVMGRTAPPTHAATLDWIIVGGESGPKARPFDIQWPRDIVAQCRAAGVPVFVKQLGARPVIGPSIDLSDWPTAKVLADADLRDMWEIRLKHRAGADPSEWPEDLRVQQFPEVK